MSTPDQVYTFLRARCPAAATHFKKAFAAAKEVVPAGPFAYYSRDEDDMKPATKVSPKTSKKAPVPDSSGSDSDGDAKPQIASEKAPETNVWVCWHGELSCEEIVLKPDASVSRLVQQARKVIDVRGGLPSELRCAVRPPGAPATEEADAALPMLSKPETLDSLEVAEGSVFVLVPRNAVIVSIGTKIERLRELFRWVQRHGGFHLHNEKADFRHRSMFDSQHYVPVGKDTIDFLLDPSVKILAVMGPAGSGKTAAAEETVPRVLVEKEDAAHPVMVCSLLADDGDLGAQFQQGFRAMFEERMDQDGSCQFDEMTAVPEERRFGTAVGVIDEVSADPVDVKAMFERFEAATPWAKVRLLVVAGTALSHHPDLPESNTVLNGVAKVRLSKWEKQQVVDLVGNVAHCQASKEPCSDKEAVRFLTRLVLGMTPGFVSGEEDTSAVAALLEKRRCVNLGHLMQHNARACRLVADQLIFLSAFLTRQLMGFGSATTVSSLEPSAHRTAEQIAEHIAAVSHLPPVEFISHYVSVLENNAPGIIAACVTRFFTLSGVSVASRATVRGVARAVLAVVNKDQRVACQDEWQSFRESHSGAENYADLAVSYGLLALDLRPSAAVSASVALEPTAVGLYIALMCLGFVLPNATTRDAFFAQVAALAVVTKYHMDDILAAGPPGVRQASAEDGELGDSDAHFDTRGFPPNMLVFAVPGSTSSDAWFNGTHMQMEPFRSTDQAVVKVELAPTTAVAAGVEVVLMCGWYLEHWWPLLLEEPIFPPTSAPPQLAPAQGSVKRRTAKRDRE